LAMSKSSATVNLSESKTQAGGPELSLVLISPHFWLPI
jgi:hypothetical protein